MKDLLKVDPKIKRQKVDTFGVTSNDFKNELVIDNWLSHGGAGSQAAVQRAEEEPKATRFAGSPLSMVSQQTRRTENLLRRITASGRANAQSRPQQTDLKNQKSAEKWSKRSTHHENTGKPANQERHSKGKEPKKKLKINNVKYSSTSSNNSDSDDGIEGHVQGGSKEEMKGKTKGDENSDGESQG